MHPNLAAALRQGATLVTANARLSRELRGDFDGLCRAAGDAVWASPVILPWSSWLEACWTECVHTAPAPEPVLLQAAQEYFVWERIVRESPGSSELLDATATAEAAAAAYRLAHDWELPLEGSQYGDYEDAERFLGWARQFEEEQRRAGWLSAARLQREVARRIAGGRIRPPAHLLYAGFDELAPAQRRLLASVQASGCVVEEAPAAAFASVQACRVALRDASREIRAAAGWARARLEAGHGARIAVVVPNLATCHAAVGRIFDEVLHPSLDPAPAVRGRAFHVSAGPALADVPIVAAALAVLGLHRERIPLAEAGQLLRSPFLAGAREERASRALLDAELRRRGLAQVNLGAIARLAGSSAPEGPPRPYACPRLARRLRAWRRAAVRLPAALPAAGWSRVFSRLVRLAGWPGERTPDSPEFQAIGRWNELLSEFAALDLVSPPMDYAAALRRLRRMAAATSFAPADQGAPIQIMGMLEAAGASFDHLWVTGLDDRVWPAPPRPDPFLPPPLQRTHGLPHSSAERELDYARRVTARLASSAAEVVMSCALREDDADLRPSPLIAGLPEGAFIPDGKPVNDLLRGATQLESLADDAGPPLPPGTLQRGGTQVFEKQAACPFRAFAELRLGARALEEPAAGLSPQERGKVMHAALERIWGELGGHSFLVALGRERRAAVVARAVRAALAEQARGRGAEQMPRLQALEAQRLARLLDAWLEVEARRAPFEVAASERQRKVELGGVAVEIQVDRVDRLASGGHVVIDYKTGPVSPASWDGERPDAPQLPLYAATLDEPVAAVLFARIDAAETRFAGLQEHAGVPGAREYSQSKQGREGEGDGTLAGQIERWRGVLESLGREFAAGIAAVSPKTPQTCMRCGLPALCRVAELAPAVEDAPEQADE